LFPFSPDAPVIRRARAPVLLFAGLTLLYLALSPWRITDRGYNGQDVHAADAWTSAAFRFLSGGGWNTPSAWSRHGVLGFAPHVPFVAASRALFGSDPRAEDAVTSLEPLLETIALLALLFAWARRLSSARRALAITLAAAFTTMLWPYAYVGLETTQSLAFFAAGYLALAVPPSGSRWLTAAFVTVAVLAVSVKSTGIFLLPAVAFLVFVFFRDRAPGDPRKLWRSLAAAAAAGILVIGGNAWTREFFWRRFGGSWANVQHTFVHDPFLFLFNAVSLVASPNKGLLFYAPLAVFGLCRIPRAISVRRRTGLFAALTFACLVAGFAFLKIWSDETWGPRYLHSAVAPLMLCLAFPASRPGRFRARRLLAAAAGILGGIVSSLGILFPYGAPYHASRLAGQNTLEAIQGDVVWNPIRFDLRLLECALRPERERIWVAAHYWWFFKTPGSAAEPAIDLSRYVHFDPLVLAPGTRAGIVFRLVACGLAGAVLVAAVAVGAWRPRSARRALGGALSFLAILLIGAQGVVWAAAVRRTAHGEFLRDAPQVVVTPEIEAEVRRVASFAGRSDVLIAITRKPGSMAFFVWRRLLYPRRLVAVLPEAIGTGELDVLRERWRTRVALSLGAGSAPVSPGFTRAWWIAPDVIVGELGPR